uniref:Uncharacterized protein n=1 Tax=Cacopsylla melanoneura TaxID=428564 RepID=A0A8D8TPQ2_9HEMI
MMESYHLSHIVCFVYFLSFQLHCQWIYLVPIESQEHWCVIFNHIIFVSLNACVTDFTAKIIPMFLSYHRNIFTQHFILTSYITCIIIIGIRHATEPTPIAKLIEM